jgi:hypothetical protein
MVVMLAFGVIGVGVVVLGGLAIASMTGTTSSAGDDRSRRASMFNGTGPMVAFGGVVLLLVLFGSAAVTLIGVGGGEDANSESSRPAPASAATPTTRRPSSTTTTTATPARAVALDPIEGPDVRMVALARDAFNGETPVVDQLARRSVFRITASNFESNATGLVEQCTLNSCTNAFPVVFDEDGIARIQYLVRDTITAADGTVSSCRADQPPCVLRLRTETDTAFLTTVFGDQAPAPRRVTVISTERGLVDKAPVTVAVERFTPGAKVHATLCAAPDTAGTKRCGPPGPVAPFTIGADGKGSTTLVIRAGHVGSDRATCGPDTPCGIVVREEASVLPAPVVAITFAAGAGARYESTRLAIGGALGATLLALAALLVRRTDWRKPTEADTPDLDDAGFDA